MEVQRWHFSFSVICSTCCVICPAFTTGGMICSGKALPCFHKDILLRTPLSFSFPHFLPHINLPSGNLSFVFLNREYMLESANHAFIYEDAFRVSQAPFLQTFPTMLLNCSPSGTQGFHAFSTSLPSKPVHTSHPELLCVEFAVLPL